MKIVKGIGYFVLLILAAALLAAAFAPSEKKIQRSITIDANAKTIYGQIAEFRNWKKWDAWYQRDTTQERLYTGRLGDRDQSYTWKSDNDNVGNGRMKMISTAENERVNYRFFFDNGGGKEDSASGYFILTEVAGTTKVEWTLESKMTYPWKIFNYFMENMVSSDFEEGLSNLKTYVENSPTMESPVNEASDVVNLTAYGVNYVAVKVVDLAMEDVTTFFEEGYKKIYNHLEINELIPKGAARGLYYSWDEENNVTTVAAAIPISEVLVPSFTKTVIGAVDSAFVSENQIITTSLGGYSDNYKSHTSLYSWIEENKKELQYPIVEEYLVGPLQTKDSTQYETKIIYHFE